MDVVDAGRDVCASNTQSLQKLAEKGLEVLDLHVLVWTAEYGVYGLKQRNASLVERVGSDGGFSRRRQTSGLRRHVALEVLKGGMTVVKCQIETRTRS